MSFSMGSSSTLLTNFLTSSSFPEIISSSCADTIIVLSAETVVSYQQGEIMESRIFSQGSHAHFPTCMNVDTTATVLTVNVNLASNHCSQGNVPIRRLSGTLILTGKWDILRDPEAGSHLLNFPEGCLESLCFL